MRDLPREATSTAPVEAGATGVRQGRLAFRFFEPLLRALADDPTRLDHIERLVSDLERTEEGRQLLPDELVAVWTSIRSVKSSVRCLARRAHVPQSDAHRH